MIEIPIIDEEKGWRPHERFSVELFDLKADSVNMGTSSAIVTVVNDDMPGTICFEAEEVWTKHGTSLNIGVERLRGKRGRISCRYQSEPDTAIDGTHFTPVSGELVFE